MAAASLADSASRSMGAIIDPKPAAPAARKKSLRDQLWFLLGNVFLQAVRMG
jgi:hypothetical protein